MRVHLLYPDHEWEGKKPYFDGQSIVDDLGLGILFRTASREQVPTNGGVKTIIEADVFLEETMRKVMMQPLETEEEIVYRQEILQDCLGNEAFIRETYEFAKETIEQWDKLGRHQVQKVSRHNAGGDLVTEVYVLRLFVEKLTSLKELLKNYKECFKSKGLQELVKRLEQEYTEKMEENLNRVLDDISFYVDNGQSLDEKPNFVKNARIVMQCDVSEGLKFNTFQLEEVETLSKKYKKQKRPKTFTQICLGPFATDTGLLIRDDVVLAETKRLEYQVVRYILAYCEEFVSQCKKFFEQLVFQAGFYMAAFHLSKRLERHEMDFCYPKVGAQDDLKFQNLKDFVMAIEQGKNPVGNTSDIRKKILLIVTGANQGGKSTFLRSIGVAQIMMQCGLFVAAEYFESGIFPSFFTHFTRREDSEMNSGRLDEELRRMNQIVEKLGERTLILLNESFATTTEKEGSVIAYDIIKALTESGVKVLTVTHLLSFAKKIHKEKRPDVEFLSAERKEDGSRTFKMLQNEPQLTSFGLDLYDRIIGTEA